jgi:tetrahydromethanopterin S-methyltransferase subunit G
MADKIDDLTTRVEGVETKVDQLSASVDQRFEAVDRRFDAVDRRFDQIEAALIEQRAYTEFAYSRLEAKIDARSDKLEAKMDAGFGCIERKLNQFIDVQLQTNQLVDRRLRALEAQRPGPP